jgi:hypothetical protein
MAQLLDRSVLDSPFWEWLFSELFSFIAASQIAELAESTAWSRKGRVVRLLPSGALGAFLCSC